MQAKYDDTKRHFILLVKKEFKYRLTEYELNKTKYVSLIRNWKHSNMVDEEIEKVMQTNKIQGKGLKRRSN